MIRFKSPKPDILLFLQQDGTYGTSRDDYHVVEIDGLEFLAFKEDFEDPDFIDDKFKEEFILRVQEDVSLSQLDGTFIHTFDDLNIKFAFFTEKTGIQRQVMLYSEERDI